MTAGPGASAGRRAAWMTALFALVIVGAYAGSIRGGFLNYDDPWLIRDNPVLARADRGALKTIWLDLSEDGRMSLGAEYLPVRDTVEWVEARVHGLDPHAMRALNLAIYVAGALLLRAWLIGAKLTRANLTRANLRGAIWTDGHTCGPESIGRCA